MHQSTSTGISSARFWYLLFASTFLFLPGFASGFLELSYEGSGQSWGYFLLPFKKALDWHDAKKSCEDLADAMLARVDGKEAKRGIAILLQLAGHEEPVWIANRETLPQLLLRKEDRLPFHAKTKNGERKLTYTSSASQLTMGQDIALSLRCTIFVHGVGVVGELCSSNSITAAVCVRKFSRPRPNLAECPPLKQHPWVLVNQSDTSEVTSIMHCKNEYAPLLVKCNPQNGWQNVKCPDTVTGFRQDLNKIPKALKHDYKSVPGLRVARAINVMSFLQSDKAVKEIIQSQRNNDSHIIEYAPVYGEDGISLIEEIMKNFSKKNSNASATTTSKATKRPTTPKAEKISLDGMADEFGYNLRNANNNEDNSSDRNSIINDNTSLGKPSVNSNLISDKSLGGHTVQPEQSTNGSTNNGSTSIVMASEKPSTQTISVKIEVASDSNVEDIDSKGNSKFLLGSTYFGKNVNKTTINRQNDKFMASDNNYFENNKNGSSINILPHALVFPSDTKSKAEFSITNDVNDLHPSYRGAGNNFNLDSDPSIYLSANNLPNSVTSASKDKDTEVLNDSQISVSSNQTWHSEKLNMPNVEDPNKTTLPNTNETENKLSKLTLPYTLPTYTTSSSKYSQNSDITSQSSLNNVDFFPREDITTKNNLKVDALLNLFSSIASNGKEFAESSTSKMAHNESLNEIEFSPRDPSISDVFLTTPKPLYLTPLSFSFSADKIETNTEDRTTPSEKIHGFNAQKDSVTKSNSDITSQSSLNNVDFFPREDITTKNNLKEDVLLNLFSSIASNGKEFAESSTSKMAEKESLNEIEFSPRDPSVSDVFLTTPKPLYLTPLSFSFSADKIETTTNTEDRTTPSEKIHGFNAQKDSVTKSNSDITSQSSLNNVDFFPREDITTKNNLKEDVLLNLFSSIASNGKEFAESSTSRMAEKESLNEIEFFPRDPSTSEVFLTTPRPLYLTPQSLSFSADKIETTTKTEDRTTPSEKIYGFNAQKDSVTKSNSDITSQSSLNNVDFFPREDITTKTNLKEDALLNLFSSIASNGKEFAESSTSIMADKESLNEIEFFPRNPSNSDVFLTTPKPLYLTPLSLIFSADKIETTTKTEDRTTPSEKLQSFDAQKDSTTKSNSDVISLNAISSTTPNVNKFIESSTESVVEKLSLNKIEFIPRDSAYSMSYSNTQALFANSSPLQNIYSIEASTVPASAASSTKEAYIFNPRDANVTDSNSKEVESSFYAISSSASNVKIVEESSTDNMANEIKFRTEDSGNVYSYSSIQMPFPYSSSIENKNRLEISPKPANIASFTKEAYSYNPQETIATENHSRIDSLLSTISSTASSVSIFTQSSTDNIVEKLSLSENEFIPRDSGNSYTHSSSQVPLTQSSPNQNVDILETPTISVDSVSSASKSYNLYPQETSTTKSPVIISLSTLTFNKGESDSTGNTEEKASVSAITFIPRDSGISNISSSTQTLSNWSVSNMDKTETSTSTVSDALPHRDAYNMNIQALSTTKSTPQSEGLLNTHSSLAPSLNELGEISTTSSTADKISSLSAIKFIPRESGDSNTQISNYLTSTESSFNKLILKTSTSSDTIIKTTENVYNFITEANRIQTEGPNEEASLNLSSNFSHTTVTSDGKSINFPTDNTVSTPTPPHNAIIFGPRDGSQTETSDKLISYASDTSTAPSFPEYDNSLTPKEVKLTTEVFNFIPREDLSTERFSTNIENSSPPSTFSFSTIATEITKLITTLTTSNPTITARDVPTTSTPKSTTAKIKVDESENHSQSTGPISKLQAFLQYIIRMVFY